MDERIQRSLYDYFKKNGIKNFVGVPDSTMKFFIDQGLSEKNVIITTREEEAIGIGTGFILSKSPTLIFMQNAGFGNSISTITSLVQLYNIPLIFLIGWRGYLKNDAPEHLGFGKIQNKILKTLELPFKIITEDNWKTTSMWAIKNLHKNNPCALIVKRDFHD